MTITDPTTAEPPAKSTCPECGAVSVGPVDCHFATCETLEREQACPVCGQSSIYSRRLDRYMHADGTDSRDCWVAISSGRVV
jgi:hypothetical protein